MDPDFQEKFRNEAKTIARLNHPNIVKVYDIEELYRTVFIVMEYLEGYTLEYLMEYMPKPSLAGMVDIILRICAGLEYAHKQGVVHQDLKPANIFMHSDGQVKIVDFGLACPQGNIDFDLPGTIFYMAPEQIEGTPVDERTDIYSLGIMVYEMLTGKRPFPEDDLGKLMDLHLTEDAPDPRSIVPDLPDELHSVIMKSIRKDPSNRYRSVSDILAELQPLADKIDLKYSCQAGEKGKMMGLFVFYRDEHELALNKLVDSFNSDISELGGVLRVTHLEVFLIVRAIIITMYSEHFGLSELPFSITPDPRYLYLSEHHREALAHLVYGINSEGGFVLLTGEVGAGKTTVCRCLLEQLPEKTDVAFLSNPKLTVDELLASVSTDWALRIQKETGASRCL